MGWWTAGVGETHPQRGGRARPSATSRARTCAATAREVHWDFIRAALGSVADTAIVPLQDVLGLGSDARMNVPARELGNWTWRLRAGELTEAHGARLRELAETFGRVARRGSEPDARVDGPA